MQYSDLDAYIKTMMLQLKVVALETYFQLSVYIFKESTGHWKHHKPLYDFVVWPLNSWKWTLKSFTNCVTIHPPSIDPLLDGSRLAT